MYAGAGGVFPPYLLALRWPVYAAMRCRGVQVYTGGDGAEELDAPADKGNRRGCMAALPVGGGRGGPPVDRRQSVVRVYCDIVGTGGPIVSYIDLHVMCY